MAENGLLVPFGVLVVEVEAGSPAEGAGLRRLDVIVALGSTRILNQEDLQQALSALSPNAVAEITTIRGTQTAKLAVAVKQTATPVAFRAPYLMLDTGGHMGQIRGLAFTSDGQYIVSASQDKVVRIWDWQNSRTVRTIRGDIGPGDEGKILAIALSGDNKWLAVAGLMAPRSASQSLELGAIRVYDFSSGELKALLKGHRNAVRALAFSSDGRLLLSGGQDNEAIVWDFSQLRPLRRLVGHGAEIYSVAFSPDAEGAVTGSLDGTVRLWKVGDGSSLVLQGHTNKVRSVAVNPVDGTIASGGDDGDIRLWNGVSGAFEKILARQGTQIYALTFSPDGKSLLSGVGDLSADRNCHVYDVATGTEIVRYTGHDNVVVATAISPDGRLAITGGGNRNDIHVWELKSGERIQNVGEPIALGGRGSIVFAAGFTKDTRRILWGKIDPCPADTSCPSLMGTLQSQARLPTPTEAFGRPENIQSELSGVQRAILTHQDHSLALRAGGPQNKPDGMLDIRRDTQLLASIERGQKDGYRHSAFTFTIDGQRLISGGSAGALISYDLDGGSTGALIGHDGDMAAVTPSPDGRFLLSASGDQTLRLWNSRTYELIVTLYYGDDGEWVVWTPQGFYTGSPGGGSLVGWQLNNGADKAADYITGDQFRKTLHRPDIVEKAIVVASAKAAVNEAYPAGFDLAALLKSKPPRMQIQSPQNGSWTSGGYVPVTVRFDTDQPIRSVDIYVGGRKVSPATLSEKTEEVPRSGSRTTSTYRVPLAEGANEISIVASNDAGSSSLSNNSLIVWHRGEGALDLRGTLYVIAIGVDKYEGVPKRCGPSGNSTCNLKFAGADAKLFAETAIRALGPVHKNTVSRVLVNGEGVASEPTRANIQAAVKILKKANEHDTILVMVAAHGEQAANGRYFILPTNVKRRPADKAGMGSNLLDWAELQSMIVRAPGRRLMFIDACHAGSAQGTRGHNSKILADARADKFVVFSATSPDQFAEEDSSYRHGLFTYFLTSGMKGKAVDETDGAVRIYHLGNYLSREVSRVTEGRQEPEFYSGMGNFVLLRRGLSPIQ